MPTFHFLEVLDWITTVVIYVGIGLLALWVIVLVWIGIGKVLDWVMGLGTEGGEVKK